MKHTNKTSSNPTKDQKDQLHTYFNMLMHTSVKERIKQIRSKSSFRRDWNKVSFADKLNFVQHGQLLALRNKLPKRSQQTC